MNAFIEAGARSVVSTLWGIMDRLLGSAVQHLGVHPAAEYIKERYLGVPGEPIHEL